MKIAVKEYLPGSLATRQPGSAQVSVYSGEARNYFEYGLDKFVEEARTLARFQGHPGIVSVYNFFLTNGTGYLVMGYVDGFTLGEYLQNQGGRIPFEMARNILTPVMDALREIHNYGVLHRDISPDNIYLTSSGQVKLLDFGAAGYAMGERSQCLSVILKPGYAPEEQYRSSGNQGPWTDVYSLAATFYRAITGQIPPDALDRLHNDEIKPPSQLGARMPAQEESALMKALRVRSADRFPDIHSFQFAIAPALAVALNQPRPLPADAKNNVIVWQIAVATLILIMILLGVSLANASTKLETTKRDLVAEVEVKKSLIQSHPSRQLSISDIKLGYTNKDGKRVQAPKNESIPRFYKDDIRYVNFELAIENNWAGIKDVRGDLGVKYFKPGSAVVWTGKESPKGFTSTIPVSASDVKTGITSGWGNANDSVYQAGVYRIEFWWEGKKIAETFFEVYELSLFFNY
jgi:serine/threonine protein kinase